MSARRAVVGSNRTLGVDVLDYYFCDVTPEVVVEVL